MLHRYIKPTDMRQLHLTIPEPCHEKWQDMSPTDQGRFCTACAKEVIDFSMMTDAEVLGYFSQVKNENVCGRTISSQLERVITMPKEPVKSKYWYWNYITMLLLFFGKSNKITAQKKGEVVVSQPRPPACTVKTGKVIRQPHPFASTQNNILVQGKIVDDHGNPISFASIRVKNTNKGVSADADGNFSISFQQGNILEISALDFITKELAADAVVKELIVVMERKVKLLSEVVIASSTYAQGRLVRYTAGAMVATVKDTTFLKRTLLTDTIKAFLNILNSSAKIYPNPVTVGNNITLSAKLREQGKYFIVITDATGKMVLQQQVSVASKQLDQTIQTDPRWSKGMYFIKLTNSKNEKVFADSFIVQ